MACAQFEIREARFPEDTPSALRFVMALQIYEQDFEPNRRIDDSVAEEYLAVLRKRAEKNGRIFIAQGDEGRALGWAVIYEDEQELYVVAEERTYGRLTELYVESDVRGKGIGRALINACEEWARGRGHKHILIGALSQNAAAMAAYQRSGYAPYAALLRKYL
jgi:GNAT superfamily N-acetyltransferase